MTFEPDKMGRRKKKKFPTIEEILSPPSPKELLDKLHRLKVEKLPEESVTPLPLKTELDNWFHSQIEQYLLEFKIYLRKQIQQIGKPNVFNMITEAVKPATVTVAQGILMELMLREIDSYKSEVKERMFQAIQKIYQESPKIRHHHLIQLLEQIARKENIEVSKRQLRRYRKEFFFEK